MVRSIYPLFAFALVASAPALAEETIATPHFRSVRLIGGGDVEIVPGPVQRVTLVNGSSDLTHFRVRQYDQLEISTSCYARCPQHYNLRIRIEDPTLPDVSVHAGGTIVARPGFAPQQDVAAAVSAGGTIDLRAIEADTVNAAVNAGGDILVHPRVALNAAITAGGDIRYWGDPQVSSAITAGGDVRRGY